MLNNNEIFNRSGKVFYISMKQNIYLKTGLMKCVSLIFEDQRKCILKGKLFTALLFMETKYRSCIMLPHNEDRLSQVCDLLMAFTLFLFMLLNNGINCQIENNLKQCVNSFCKILHIVLCSINFP